MIGRWGDREFGNWGSGEKRKKPDNPFIELHLPLFDLADRVKVNHKYQYCQNQDSTLRIVPSQARTSSCNRYFPKSRLHTTFQPITNISNPGFWFVIQIEAFLKENFLASYPRFKILYFLPDVIFRRNGRFDKIIERV